MIVTQQPSISIVKLEEGIIGVYGISNQAVIQRFSKPDVYFTFQRPRFVLQDITIVCWLNVVAWWLVTVKEGKILFLARSMCNHMILSV